MAGKTKEEVRTRGQHATSMAAACQTEYGRSVCVCVCGGFSKMIGYVCCAKTHDWPTCPVPPRGGVKQPVVDVHLYELCYTVRYYHFAGILFVVFVYRQTHKYSSNHYLCHLKSVLEFPRYKNGKNHFSFI